MFGVKNGAGSFIQNFEIRVSFDDIDKIDAEEFANNMIDEAGSYLENIELDEFWTEDDSVYIKGNYSGRFTYSSCPATMWEPAEYEEERLYLENADLESIAAKYPGFKDLHLTESDPDNTYDGEVW